ncbi:hypothetical protein PanWU01x14_030610 [Parasponia andersonii]|uniref:Ulp1 protease family, C-terminal catalytic domain containing protein n=1 Tax=Parasponia andersonii TaxID=3476 RepID=A0A2P5DUT1_PARAD|nr:hypothetical protein PanWU01x14_030610 [Parasponia andersonii]
MNQVLLEKCLKESKFANDKDAVSMACLKKHDESKKLKISKKSGNVYKLHGFPLAFQIWFYESIPTLSEEFFRKLEDSGIPYMINWSTDIKALSRDLEREVFQSKEIEIRKVTTTDEEKKMLNLSGLCYNSKDPIVRNLAEEDDDFNIPAPKLPLSTEPSILKLTKSFSSKSTKPSISKLTDIHTNDYAKGIEEDEFEINDQDTAIANDSAKDTKINENEKKQNDGRDSKSAGATDSNAKSYTENKDTDRENHIETVVNKDKGSDVDQGDGGKLDVIDYRG